MRIAIFTPYLYPFHLGMLKTLKKLQNVQEAELFVAGIYGNYPFEKLLKEAKILKSIGILGQKIPTINACFKFMKFKPNIVILFGIESVIGIVLYFISRIFRARIIVIVEENYVSLLKHHNAFLSIMQTFKKMLVKFIYKDADVLIAESKASMRYVIQILNVSRRKPIHVRPHGIDIQSFLNMRTISPNNAKQMLINKLALPKNILDKIWISFIGETSFYKGADVLIDAIATLKKIYSKDHYIFLIPKDLPLLRDRTELRMEYLSKLAELTREGIVITYPKLPPELMPILYRASDIVVLPSRLLRDSSSDRSPNVAIEALAAGNILIASYVGGIPDIVGDAGIYVKPNDHQYLAVKIMEVLENIQKFSYLRELAVKRSKEYFDIRVYTLAILKLILEEMKRKW